MIDDLKIIRDQEDCPCCPNMDIYFGFRFNGRDATARVEQFLISGTYYNEFTRTDPFSATERWVNTNRYEVSVTQDSSTFYSVEHDAVVTGDVGDIFTQTQTDVIDVDAEMDNAYTDIITNGDLTNEGAGYNDIPGAAVVGYYETDPSGADRLEVRSPTYRPRIPYVGPETLNSYNYNYIRMVWDIARVVLDGSSTPFPGNVISAAIVVSDNEHTFRDVLEYAQDNDAPERTGPAFDVFSYMAAESIPLEAYPKRVEWMIVNLRAYPSPSNANAFWADWMFDGTTFTEAGGWNG